MPGIDSVFKTSAYLIGAATGVAFMVPLTAGALATGSLTRVAPQPVAIESFGPALATHQAHLVNRTGKTSRLDIAAPALVAPAADTPVATSERAPTPAIVNSQPEPAPVAPSRATRTPKGCLSALGVTKSSLSTEELTVCVADASMIGQN